MPVAGQAAGEQPDRRRRVLAEYDVLTGHPAAHDRQQANGPLPPGRRLLPKTPFVTGAEFTAATRYAGGSVEGMRAPRGEFARQLRDLPDGTETRLRVVD